MINKNIKDDNVQNKLDGLIELGTKIKKNCRKMNKNFIFSAHTDFSINNKKIDNIDEQNIIDYWLNMINKYDSSENEIDDENIEYYYINDKNRNLSPSDLYDKLSSMKKYNKTPINIEKCIMISEKSFDVIKQIVLRFFVSPKNTYLCSDIKEKILKDSRIVNVQLSSKDGGHEFAGFGYAYIKDKQSEKELLANHITIDDIDILFDLG